jgi:hypothetical protein
MMPKNDPLMSFVEFILYSVQVLPIVGSIITGFLVLALQCLVWLMDAVWEPIPLRRVLVG